jgi:hypothetical protein
MAKLGNELIQSQNTKTILLTVDILSTLYLQAKSKIWSRFCWLFLGKETKLVQELWEDLESCMRELKERANRGVL